jgi:hypothetical protein
MPRDLAVKMSFGNKQVPNEEAIETVLPCDALRGQNKLDALGNYRGDAGSASFQVVVMLGMSSRSKCLSFC